MSRINAIMKMGMAVLLASQMVGGPHKVFADQVPAGDAAKAQTAGEVVVSATSLDDQGAFLSDVQGTNIYSGKKTTRINLGNLPQISNNNFRQALIKAPGLLLSEETTPLFSVGYRGLDPHRAQFMQVMKDGVPIHADMLGYPEAYYVPPTQTIDKIEFVRGGAGLMFGPQPGGALNFVTHEPVIDSKFRLYSENTFGSDNFYSNYDAISGTSGPLGYYGYFHLRRGEGFRRGNSDFEVISSGLKAIMNQTGDSRLIVAYDEYHEEHGEPGGLTRAQFDADESVNTRGYDRFRLERYYGSIKYEKEISEETQFDFLIYGGQYRRFSKRQNGGGFGTIPGGTTNSIEEQDFYNFGMEPRVRHTYEWLGEEHTLSLGAHTFMSHSPRTDQTGATPSADSGPVARDAIRDSWYFSLFAENLFRFGNLSVTPGVRFENIWQRIFEPIHSTRQPVDERQYDFAPLFGVGIEYQLTEGLEAYTNISQSYRPKIFTQSVPTGPTQVVNADLEEGKGVQYDFGLRGQPMPFVSWDIDYFLMVFSNQIGTSGNTVVNAGRAHHQGVEFFTDVDLIGAWDYFKDTEHGSTWGSFSPFVSLTLLDAFYTTGPFDGKTPAYAPQYNFRFGSVYDWQDRFKISLLSTFVDNHFADDANTENFHVPSYKVWDLTAEAKLYEQEDKLFGMSVFAGINNLFGEKYYSRVRSDGIDPAYGRNFNAGFKINLG